MSEYLLAKQVCSLIEDCPDMIADLANVSALLYECMDRLNWVGFYRMDGEGLILGPFQGKTACIRIPVGKGVCGTAVKEDRSILVPDVHAFPGHIACDSASASELVIPMHTKGRVWGVLDIDSPVRERFTETDRLEMEACVRVIEESGILKSVQYGE